MKMYPNYNAAKLLRISESLHELGIVTVILTRTNHKTQQLCTLASTFSARMSLSQVFGVHDPRVHD